MKKKHIIIGLGNPGDKYLLTPHNIGWIVLDALANHLGINWQLKKHFSAKLSEEKDILLIKPMTYMNLSGVAVKSVMNYYKLSIEQILVIHDDIDLPFLSLRFQKNRGPAGHNGLININKELGSQNYTRLRVGMNVFTELVSPNTKKNNKENANDESNNNEKHKALDQKSIFLSKAKNLFSMSHLKPAIKPAIKPSIKNSKKTQVLKPFSKREQDLLPEFLETAMESILFFIKEGLEKTANRYNSSPIKREK